MGPPLRPHLLPHPEEGVLGLRLPLGAHEELPVGEEDDSQEEPRHWPHALREGPAAPLQERLPGEDAGAEQEGRVLVSVALIACHKREVSRRFAGLVAMAGGMMSWHCARRVYLDGVAWAGLSGAPRSAVLFSCGSGAASARGPGVRTGKIRSSR